MAKRRNQIVHHADLHDGQSREANPWEIVDEWQLIQWHLAVSAFYHRLRRATGPTSLVEDRASQNVESAVLQNVQFARSMIAFSSLPPEQRLEGLQQLLGHVENILKALKLEVAMFLGPDGRPIDDAI